MRQFFRTGMLVAALGGIFVGGAGAQDRVRIGVLNDQSGVFSTYQGIGSVIAAQMAVEDYGGKAAGKPVDVITADHQNKTDVGVGIARRWYDTESIDAIFDLPNSAIALAVANMSEQKNKVFIGSGAGTALLTGEKCTPNTVHWTYDTYAYGRGLGKAVVAQRELPARSAHAIWGCWVFKDRQQGFCEAAWRIGRRHDPIQTMLHPTRGFSDGTCHDRIS